MAPGWRITAERACAGRNAPTWPNADFISSIMRSITWPGPSAPSAPRPHRKALPANAKSAPSATARTTSSPERMPLSSITVARPPTASAMVGHDDAINPKRDALLGIGGMENPLDHQRPLPALAIARDFVPGEGAA